MNLNLKSERLLLRAHREAIIAATAITGSVVCEGRAGGREVGQSILCQVCARAVCKEIQE